MLHHTPQHVSSSTLLIIRRTNFTTTVRSSPAYCTAAYRGDDTRGCGDTIGPPDDEQRAARNMFRSVV